MARVAHLDVMQMPYVDARVFYYLRDMKVGDDISVTRADGGVAEFKVTSRDETPRTSFRRPPSRQH